MFTNALLSNHDITSLIRDTEAHERALFSVPPPPPAAASSNNSPADPPPAQSSASRRQTVFNVAAGEVTTGPPTTRGGAPRRHTAVAAVLGGDLHAQISRPGPGGRADVDVDVLLRGAEKLCGVYALPGAAARIAELRQRHAHQSNTLAYYEARVAEQTRRLDEINREWLGEGGGETGEDDVDEDEDRDDVMTEEDLRREEEEAKELDRKKKELQQRLKAMEKDLGGLLHM